MGVSSSSVVSRCLCCSGGCGRGCCGICEPPALEDAPSLGVGGCCEGWWSMEVRNAGCQSCSPACRKVKLGCRPARALAESPSSYM